MYNNRPHPLTDHTHPMALELREGTYFLLKSSSINSRLLTSSNGLERENKHVYVRGGGKRRGRGRGEREGKRRKGGEEEGGEQGGEEEGGEQGGEEGGGEQGGEEEGGEQRRGRGRNLHGVIIGLLL